MMTTETIKETVNVLGGTATVCYTVNSKNRVNIGAMSTALQYDYSYILREIEKVLDNRLKNKGK